MKKFITAILIGFAFAGCSDDDSGSKAMVPSTITFIANNSSYKVDFGYDDKRRVVHHNIFHPDNIQRTYEYTYGSNGKVASFHYIKGASDGNITLTYDDKGRISSFVDGDQVKAVTYSGNSFTYNGETYVLDGRGNLTTAAGVQFTYLSKKSAVANIKAWDIVLLVANDPYFYYYASKNAVQNFNVFNTGVTFTHTFGPGGLPVSTAIGLDLAVQYDYLTL